MFETFRSVDLLSLTMQLKKILGSKRLSILFLLVNPATTKLIKNSDRSIIIHLCFVSVLILL